MVLCGEPGIGKTRLLAALQAGAVERGVRVAAATCQDRDRVSSFVPWTELLRQLFERLTPSEVVDAVGDDYWSAIRLMPELGQKVWLFSPDRPDRSSWDPRGFLDALVRVFVRVADRTPVMVALDDLGWADASSLELFLALGRAAPGHPLLLAGAYRDSHREQNAQLDRLAQSLAQDRRVRVLEVGPLQDGAIRQLVGAWFGLSEIGDDLAAFVTSRSAGNPFFAEELVQLLIESGELTDRGAVVHAESGLRGGVPGTVRAMIEQRLARLPAEDVDTVRAASALGLEFPYTLLLESSGYPEEQVLRALEHAREARLLRESIDRDRRTTYAFSHPLIQETLATQLLEPRARRIHEHAAQALIRDSSGADASDARIAYHLLRTDHPSRALEFAIRAGDRAAELHAPAEAAALYRTALQVMADAPATEQSARIEEALADQEFQMGDRRDARRLCKVSASHRLALGAPVPAAMALLKAAREAPTTEAEELLASARDMLGPSPEPRALFAWQMAKGDAHDPISGSQVHVPAFREALAIAESMDDPVAIATACRSLAANLPVGEVPYALALLDRAAEIARKHGLLGEAFWAQYIRGVFGVHYYGLIADWNRHGEALLRLGTAAGQLHDAQFALLSGGAWMLLLRGRIREAAGYTSRWAERMRLFSVIDDRFVGIYQAYPLLLQGEDAQAAMLLQQVVDQGDEFGKWIFQVGGQVWLAHLDTRHGEHARALRRLEEARDIAVRAGPSIIQARHGPYTVERLTRAQIACDDLAGAEASVDLLGRWAVAGDSQTFQAYWKNARGQLRIAQGDLANGKLDLEGCAAVWTQLDYRYELARCHEDLGLLHWGQGEADAARRCWADARTIFQEMAAPAEEARVNAYGR